MKHKVKVTILDKKCYPELQRQYCKDPESGPCPCYNVGDEFIFMRDEGRDDYWHLGLNTLVKTNGNPDTVAGCMEEGETPEESARRETREESGHDVIDLVPLGRSLPAPGYCDEVHHHFFATLAAEPAGQHLDTDENLAPIPLTAAEIDAAIDDGTITDGKTIILWHLYKRKHPSP